MGFGAAVGGHDHRRYLASQPLFHRGDRGAAGLATVEVMIGDDRLRLEAIVDAFDRAGCIGGDRDDARPAAEQRRHARQDRRFVVDDEEADAVERAAAQGRGRFAAGAIGDAAAIGHGDAEGRTPAGHRSEADRMRQHAAGAFDDGQPQPDAARIAVEPREFVEDDPVLVGGDPWPPIDDFDPQARAGAAAADDDARAGRIAQRIRNEVLQDAAQQAVVAVDDGARCDDAEFDAARQRQRREFGVEVGEQRRDGKIPPLRLDGTGIEDRDLEQCLEQVLDRQQRRFDAIDQRPAFAGQPPLRQRRDEQSRRVERLQQIMAGRGEKAGLRQIGILGAAFRFAQLGIDLGQLGGAFGDTAFEGARGVALLGNVLDQREPAPHGAAFVAVRDVFSREHMIADTVAAAGFDFERRRRSRQHLGDMGLQQAVAGIAEHAANVAADERFGAATEHFDIMAIGELIAFLIVEKGDERGGAIGDEPQPGLAVAQGLDEAMAFGHIGKGHHHPGIGHRCPPHFQRAVAPLPSAARHGAAVVDPLERIGCHAVLAERVVAGEQRGMGGIAADGFGGQAQQALERLVPHRQPAIGIIDRHPLRNGIERCLQQVGFFGKAARQFAGIGNLHVGDVGIDADDAAFEGAHFVDLDPAAIRQRVDMGTIGDGVLRQAFRKPAIGRHQRAQHAAFVGDQRSDRIETDAGDDAVGNRRPQPEIGRIAQHQAIIGIEQRKTFVDAVDGIAQAVARRIGLDIGALEFRVRRCQRPHRIIQLAGAIANAFLQRDRRLEQRKRPALQIGRSLHPVHQRGVDQPQLGILGLESRHPGVAGRHSQPAFAGRHRHPIASPEKVWLTWSAWNCSP